MDIAVNSREERYSSIMTTHVCGKKFAIKNNSRKHNTTTGRKQTSILTSVGLHGVHATVGRPCGQFDGCGDAGDEASTPAAHKHHVRRSRLLQYLKPAAAHAKAHSQTTTCFTPERSVRRSAPQPKRDTDGPFSYKTTRVFEQVW